MDSIASLFQIETLITIFAGLAVFGTIITITAPYFENDKLQARAVRVERGDGLAVLRRLAADSMDVIFLDPPFDSELFGPALQAAARVV